MAKESAKKVDEAAAQWVMRLDRGLSAADERELDAWLDADTRHMGAFGRMQALFWHTERSVGLGADYKPEKFRPSPKPAGWLDAAQFASRRAAAAASVAAVGGGLWVHGKQARYSTKMGEVRVVALSDGSVVTLNTASTMTVRFSRRQRLIKLVGGEALFDVAKDPARPFLVAAGDLNVQAIGTRFTVRLLEGAPPQVVVQEGVVEVRNVAAPQTEGVRLSANMRGIASGIEPVATKPILPSETERELIWREGRLAFAGASLAEASAEFARYSDIRIVIDDAGSGTRGDQWLVPGDRSRRVQPGCRPGAGRPGSCRPGGGAPAAVRL